MLLYKTAPVLTILCLFMTAMASAQSSQDIPGGTAAGLRIHLDRDGNLLQHPAPDNVSTAIQRSASDPVTTSSAVRGAAATPSITPTVVRTNPLSGTVVRLNGRFRAASRVHIDSNGKLQGDCQINPDPQKKKGSN